MFDHAHETAHALSIDENHHYLGLGKIETAETGQKNFKGNKWLMEGATILWERESTVDNSFNEKAGRDPYYGPNGWYLTATLTFLKEIGASEDLLLRTHFGNQKARTILESLTQKQFNASVEELQHLMLIAFPEDANKVLRGEKGVVVKLYPKEQEEIKQQKRRLVEIFPNIELREQLEKQ